MPKPELSGDFVDTVMRDCTAPAGCREPRQEYKSRSLQIKTPRLAELQVSGISVLNIIVTTRARKTRPIYS